MDPGDIELEIENIFLEIAGLGSVQKLRVIDFIEEKLLLLKRELSPLVRSKRPENIVFAKVKRNHLTEVADAAGEAILTANDSINKHFRPSHQGKYMCNVCSHSFSRNKKLEIHKSNPQNCQKYLKSKPGKETEKEQHNEPSPILKDKYDEKQFLCGLCDWKTNNRKVLSEHLVKHSGKYKCYTCGQCFGRRAALDTHLSDPENCIEVIKSLDKNKVGGDGSFMVQLKLEAMESSDFETD